MAQRPINVVIKGDYTDKDIKRAIRDLHTLEKQGPKTGKALTTVGSSLRGMVIGAAAGLGIATIGRQLASMSQAAIDDERSVIALRKALENVGLGAAATDAEKFVEQLMLATGVADEDLRGSLQTLTTATGDFAQSQRLVNDALDISAATGKDLGTVSLALAKAYNGNIGALTRLGVPMDAAIIKSKDFAGALKVLETRYGGQAAARADSMAGKIARISMAASEASETVGYELVRAVDDVSQSFGGTDGLVGGITAAGDGLADFVAGVGNAIEVLAELKVGNDEGGISFVEFATNVYKQTPGLGLFINMTQGLAAAGADSREEFDAMTGSLRGSEALYAGYISTLDASTQAEKDRRDALEKSKSSADRLKDSLDKLYGGNRSIIGQRIDLRQGFAKGPGKDATRDEVKRWALSQAQTASGLAGDLFSQGKKGAALNTYQGARQDLMGALGNAGIGKGFLNSILGPAPKWLRGDVAQQASAAGAREWQKNAAPIYQTVTITVESPAQAAVSAMNLARLAKLERGMAPTPTSGANPLGYAWGGIR